MAINKSPNPTIPALPAHIWADCIASPVLANGVVGEGVWRPGLPKLVLLAGAAKPPKVRNGVEVGFVAFPAAVKMRALAVPFAGTADEALPAIGTGVTILDVTRVIEDRAGGADAGAVM